MHLVSSIHLAVKLNNLSSIKILLDAIFENFNEVEYKKLIMYDLDILWKSKQINLEEFLGRSLNEINSQKN